MTKLIDQSELLRALTLWFQPGDVFEVRVLKAVTPGYLRPHVESGYFDYEHRADVILALEQLRAYGGAYATANPVNPALLARAVNHLKPAEQNATTTDADIPRRRWLLLDCDAVRPSGISSTDPEHAAALAKAREIRAGLATLGWPAPVLTDSGNGAQLMYRLDLPAADQGRVQQAIVAIAAASSEQVKVI